MAAPGFCSQRRLAPRVRVYREAYGRLPHFPVTLLAIDTGGVKPAELTGLYNIASSRVSELGLLVSRAGLTNAGVIAPRAGSGFRHYRSGAFSGQLARRSH